MLGGKLNKELTNPRLSDLRITGIVVDNNDPKKLQRVKVRIPDLHRNVPDEHLPWANGIRTAHQGGASGLGSIAIPQIGTKVLVQYNDNDPHFLTYTGVSDTDDVVSQELLEAYPNGYGHIDKSGNLWFVNNNDHSLRFHHVSGTIIRIEGDGTVSIIVAKDLNVSAVGNITIKNDGDMKLHAGGAVELVSGSGTKIESGGDIELVGTNVKSNTGPADLTPLPAEQPTARTAPQLPNPTGKVNL